MFINIEENMFLLISSNNVNNIKNTRQRSTFYVTHHRQNKLLFGCQL